jgi:hypothetical protein
LNRAFFMAPHSPVRAIFSRIPWSDKRPAGQNGFAIEDALGFGGGGWNPFTAIIGLYFEIIAYSEQGVLPGERPQPNWLQYGRTQRSAAELAAESQGREEDRPLHTLIERWHTPMGERIGQDLLVASAAGTEFGAGVESSATTANAAARNLTAGELLHEGALLVLPGYDLGTCISSGECGRLQWSVAVLGTIPGGKGIALGVKAAVKAGAGIIGRVAARGATRAEILAANRAAGRAAERLAARQLVAEGNTILGSQVSVRTSLGLRRIDHLIQTPGGQIIAIEVKAGNSVRSSAQLAKDAVLSIEGGVLVGKNAPAALRGQQLIIQTSERLIR